MKVLAVPKVPLQYQFSMHCSGKIEITSALSRDVLVIWDCATSKNISGVGIVVVGIAVVGIVVVGIVEAPQETAMQMQNR